MEGDIEQKLLRRDDDGYAEAYKRIIQSGNRGVHYTQIDQWFGFTWRGGGVRALELAGYVLCEYGSWVYAMGKIDT